MKKSQPLYDISKTFLENLHDGPQFSGTIPPRIMPNQKLWTDFLGYTIMSPIGVAACAATTSKGIALLAQLGCDVLTYKTIRAAPFPAHPLPNIVFLNAQEVETAHKRQQPVFATETPDFNNLALANSFGNAGPSAEFWHNDIKKAKAALQPGQILIVSIYGVGKTTQELIEDYCAAAHIAAQAGADALEVNLSCPNIGDGKALLYHDPELVYLLIKHIVAAVKFPVIAKIGLCEKNLLKQILLAIARAGGRGICGINSIPMEILNRDGTPAFGSESRKISGVCGAPLRPYALDFVKNARNIIDQEKLDLTISGVGGVTKPEHFAELLNAGANVALSAAGIMFNPYLAHEFHKQRKAFYEQSIFASHIAHHPSNLQQF